jgi:preprotein translocase subunit SecA
MTGTADTEAAEFAEIYGLNVSIIPTNRPMAREDNDDLVFLTQEAKFKALIGEIELLRKKDAPILVGTASVESSEIVSALLNKKNISHQVLNAKQHEKEAEVIANAGRPGVVTIATNMAGRGTDIVLGGKENIGDGEWEKRHQVVLDAGGLHILGTERHESRRIDNQLRGRSGRQGDPGYSKFFLSLEDDLLRLFISDSRRGLFEKIGMGDDHIEHKMLSRGIENAQKRIENKNFDARKNLLEYDDVSNDQRQAIYSLRNQLLEEEDISESIDVLIEDQFKSISNTYVPIESIEPQWKTKELDDYLIESYSLQTNIHQVVNDDKTLIPESIGLKIIEIAKEFYEEKYKAIGNDKVLLEKQVMLQVLDVHWKEHLSEIDHLRGSIGLRAYAQKNPKNEFKREAYSMFENMLDEINSETVRILFSLQIKKHENFNSLSPEQDVQDIKLQKDNSPSLINETSNESEPVEDIKTITRDEPKVGRNDIVKISNGKETKEIKFKKAQPLIDSGDWKII